MSISKSLYILFITILLIIPESHVYAGSKTEAPDVVESNPSPSSIPTSQPHKSPYKKLVKKQKPHKQQHINTPKDGITGFSASMKNALSYNNLGVRISGRAGYQWRMYGSQHSLLHSNFVWLGGTGEVTPGFGTVGAQLKVQPFSFIHFDATIRHRVYFPVSIVGVLFENQDTIKGTFQGVSSFSDGEARLKKQLDSLVQSNSGRVSIQGTFLTLATGINLQLGKLWFYTYARYSRWWLDYQDKQESLFFYEPGLDVILKKTDSVLNVNSFLAYPLGSIHIIAISSFIRSFEAGMTRWVVGPAVSVPLGKNWGVLRNPTLFATVRWYAIHKWRKGLVPNIIAQIAWDF